MEQITARTFYYFIEFYLDGVSEPVIYETSKEDAERLQSILHNLEYSPEDKYAIEDDYFYFGTPDRQQVVVHLPDIQSVRILIERQLHQVRRRRFYVPRLRAYLRGRPAPIVEDLDDEDPGDHYNLLSPQFFDAAPNDKDPDLPKMLSYLNAEGDRCVLSRRHLMMWAVDWEYRISLTTIFEADGLYRAREDESGVWRIQVWRLQFDLFMEEELSSEWYANVEFVPDDQQPGEDEVLYEFDTYGPYPTKSEAIAAAQADFESGRYRNQITQLREPGSLGAEEI
jgi:hypothetical protein